MLKVEGLWKSYGKKVIIKNINFSANKGEIFAILGPNGAGKTTCFYTIFGIIKPDKGKIILQGHDITNLPMHIRSKIGLGYLPQEASVFQGLTTEENIMCVLENFNFDSKERKYKLEKLLDEFNLSSIRKSISLSLSGGERRRLEIARLLASEPNFILLDEPFAGVDPVSVNDVVEIIKSLSRRNIGIIITDHNVREVLKFADKICIIYEGNVLVVGKKEEILSNEMVKKVYLGENFMI